MNLAKITRNHKMIEDKYQCLLDYKKISLSWITKYILEFQQKYNLDILNPQCYSNYFQNYFGSDIPSHIISQIYNNYELFDEILKFTTKYTKIGKSNQVFNNYIQNKDERMHFYHFLNMFVLRNLIIKYMKDKDASEKIQRYRIIPNLYQIKSGLIEILRLNRLDITNADIPNDAIADIINIYNYSNINPIDLSEQISADEFIQIYDLFKN